MIAIVNSLDGEFSTIAHQRLFFLCLFEVKSYYKWPSTLLDINPPPLYTSPFQDLNHCHMNRVKKFHFCGLDVMVCEHIKLHIELAIQLWIVHLLSIV